MNKVRVAVFGASGYSGEELIRLLRGHPQAEICAVTSRQYAGQKLEEVFPRFLGSGLAFVGPDVAAIAKTVDAAFLALPHGLAAEYAAPLLEHGLTVLDISADFRLKSPAKYREYYNREHPAPELLAQAVYGLPERYRDALKTAKLIACPGCYPTDILLPLCPVLAAGLVRTEGISIASLSGVSGAGRKLELPYLFAECNESIRPYAITGHRHIPEIEQELAVAAGVAELSIVFTPHLIPVSRGILSTIYLEPADPGLTAEGIAKVLHDAYDDEPFVRVLPPGKLPDTGNVLMTNTCEISCACDGRTGRVILNSAIDNLTKGAAGQAVQCLNLAFGLEESTGLLP